MGADHGLSTDLDMAWKTLVVGVCVTAVMMKIRGARNKRQHE
jgi:hypothetical protein